MSPLFMFPSVFFNQSQVPLYNDPFSTTSQVTNTLPTVETEDAMEQFRRAYKVTPSSTASNSNPFGLDDIDTDEPTLNNDNNNDNNPFGLPNDPFQDFSSSKKQKNVNLIDFGDEGDTTQSKYYHLNVSIIK